MENIKTITEEQASELLDRYCNNTLTNEDKGRFLIAYENGTFTAIDNTSGDCWTEDFKTRYKAVEWLCGKEKNE
ncbi:MAG: hypothetical protein WBI17_07155 [Clostridiaceae bacterium]